MNRTVKEIFSNWRVWILIFVIIISVVAINPHPFRKGVAIRSIEKNSPAELAGISNPKENSPLMSREVIKRINHQEIKDLTDYYEILSILVPNSTVLIETDKDKYVLNVDEKDGNPYLGLNVYNAPKSNLKFGLDVIGGTRVVLKPSEEVNSSDMNLVAEILRERLNAYGLSDIVIRTAKDLDGSNYVIVEIAGTNSEEAAILLEQQGKFEAKIGNKTVFSGGEQDIKYVCRTPQCSSAADASLGGCRPVGDGNYVCTFSFSITLSNNAAEKMANITKDLQIVYDESGEGHLNETLDLYLDDELIDSLRVSASLKGRAVTEIMISGPGIGPTQQEALLDSQKSMKQLQTILLTGSLPFSLEIVKMDTISSKQGSEFLFDLLLIGIVGIIIISIILYLRFKEIMVVVPSILILLSEVIILFGFAALVSWNLDISALTGLIVSIGTGIDDQIVMLSEIDKSKKKKESSWKQILKSAFFIIIGAYLTTLVSMIPLFFAGAGLLRGFAFTTIVGITIGIIITRPAFSDIIRTMFKNKYD